MHRGQGRKLDNLSAELTADMRRLSRTGHHHRDPLQLLGQRQRLVRRQDEIEHSIRSIPPARQGHAQIATLRAHFGLSINPFRHFSPHTRVTRRGVNYDAPVTSGNCSQHISTGFYLPATGRWLRSKAKSDSPAGDTTFSSRRRGTWPRKFEQLSPHSASNVGEPSRPSFARSEEVAARRAANHAPRNFKDQRISFANAIRIGRAATLQTIVGTSAFIAQGILSVLLRTWRYEMQLLAGNCFGVRVKHAALSQPKRTMTITQGRSQFGGYASGIITSTMFWSANAPNSIAAAWKTQTRSGTPGKGSVGIATQHDVGMRGHTDPRRADVCLMAPSRSSARPAIQFANRTPSPLREGTG